MDISNWQNFFDCCVGNWQTQRTYHYLTYQEVERSQTDFIIKPLNVEDKQKVITDNKYSTNANLQNSPGYHLEFSTISEKGETKNQSLNLLFVTKKQEGIYLEGDYLRDKAYEEAKPIIASFVFNLQTLELKLTTYYTKVVSVDSITLINPKLRIRKILNYRRPPEGEVLKDVVLVGFGVEQKI